LHRSLTAGAAAQDEASFKSYHGEMPWLAVPFESE
jgi:hypothetical protein